jgi:hypothetical protein
MNPRRAPQWICAAHPSNEMDDLGINPWASASPALPAPVVPKSLSLPTDNGIWLDDMQHFSPPRPEFGCKNPEESISIGQPRPGMSLFEERQLLPQRQILEREIG